MTTSLRDAAQAALDTWDEWHLRTDVGSLTRAMNDLRVALAEPEQARMSEEELERLATGDEFLLYCSQDDFNEIARAVEYYHGIGGKE